MKRLVIFDCDGTLVDGQAAICDTMDEAFAAARLPSPDRNEVRRMVGLSLPQALRQLAPGATDDQRDIALDAYKSGYRDRRFKGTLEEPLYDGMAELIDRLVDAGWLLAVATGKSDRGLHSCLDMHGIKHHFISLQTADRHPSKPHPSMIEQALAEADVASDCAVMIGDTTFDIEMARAAGVRAIGVAWGYHEPSELLEAGAQGVAGTMQELEDMINAGA
ncbi:HAD-IA family hydrolase [Qipengyuania sp. GH1]|uniref:HAD-IA family hydrolase n=1 Tax=Qipengyuania aestuarii TaxID=2867241 RepID=UPI001C87002B|nr:HAD-IA family hydrolase [Qipengyuania aestuarii]